MTVVHVALGAAHCASSQTDEIPATPDSRNFPKMNSKDVLKRIQNAKNVSIINIPRSLRH